MVKHFDLNDVDIHIFRSTDSSYDIDFIIKIENIRDDKENLHSEFKNVDIPQLRSL